MSAAQWRRFWHLRMAGWVRRRQGLDVLPLSLHRRRIYILPTRAGLAFVLLVFLMLVAGLNYANSLALFLTFLLGGFGLITMHQCHRNLLGTTLRNAAAAPTFATRSGVLRLELENSSGEARYQIAGGVDQEPLTATDLPARGRRAIDISIAAPVRGVVHIGRVRLTTVHPFGLFRAWSWVHPQNPLRMIVYPRPSGSLPMPADDAHTAGRLARGGAGADEWLGLRPFRDGDSPRQVDWKAYAREAPLLVKEYSASASELRVFRFDALPGLSPEGRLEQLARWIVDAEADGERYGLELPDTRIPADRGPEHRHRCLSALALYGREERVQ
jgi:uncharacterized protein (DUF58 family)